MGTPKTQYYMVHLEYAQREQGYKQKHLPLLSPKVWSLGGPVPHEEVPPAYLSQSKSSFTCRDIGDEVENV